MNTAGARRFTIKGCARCRGEGHKALIFREFKYPAGQDSGPPLTHWALCPTTGEPILMALSPDDPA